jgi:AraC family transcriptional regulator of adaptative response / DNA-3-methyladenine glycosylase II
MSDFGETERAEQAKLAAMSQIDPAIAHAAIEARDARFDGVFFTGVVSTGIYCRCVCPARCPKRENRRFFQSAAAAEKAGFRPCLMCRPELAPGAAPIDRGARIAAQALQRIEAGALEEAGLEDLAGDLGVTGRHLRRVVSETFGASPIELAQTHRLLTAKRLLSETDLSLADIAFASGFQSVRRFNALFQSRYALAPSRLRKGKKRAPAGMIVLKLHPRGVFDLGQMCAFYRARALTGVEAVSSHNYARTLEAQGAKGVLVLAQNQAGLTLEISETLAPVLRPLIAAVRGALDLDADMVAIDAALQNDKALNVARDPFVRLPGGMDAFEIAVRAIIGQQVTVKAARTVTQRIVDAFGEPIATGDAALTRLFPSAARLANADAGAIAARGMPLKRAETLVALARAVAEGRLRLARGAIAAGRAGLAQIPGIGPWTIEYVALRGLGDPDAFPAGDSALKAALGLQKGMEARAAQWRPWRAYAAVRLWRGAPVRGDER